jgi:hypothetical protein
MPELIIRLDKAGGETVPASDKLGLADADILKIEGVFEEIELAHLALL